MARKWFGIIKAVEEPSELITELAKLQAFPSGKHPARKRSVVLSAEDEVADVLAILEYFIDRNGLDRARIERRKKSKYKKFSRWWGVPKIVTKLTTRPKRKTTKIKAK